MSNVCTTESISDEDIDEIVDSTGVEREIIEKSVELDKAEKRFEKYNRKQQEKENKRKYRQKFQNFLSFTKQAIFSTSEIPNFATVKSVETPERYKSIIILHTETNYPSLPSDSKNKINKSFRFNLSNKESLRMFNHIINSAGIDSIKDIVDKKIPTKPISTTNYKYHVDKVSYDVHIPEKTIYGRFIYYFNRLRMKLNCIERCSDDISDSLHGNYDVNRNMFLLLAILTLPFGLINTIFLIPSITFVSIGYIIPVILTFLIGLLEFLTNEPENRDYIQRKIQK